VAENFFLKVNKSIVTDFNNMTRTQHPLFHLLRERILVLDGAMGTMIQGYNLSEEDFRGTQFTGFQYDLKGNNDLLCITQPDIIREIHANFLSAGADIIETNTFNANPISQDDYHLSHITYDLNVAAAKVAREAADEFTQKNPANHGLWLVQLAR
jgi:5-methyltetrahydrofolate--homocysteine methyltransferase